MNSRESLVAAPVPRAPALRCLAVLLVATGATVGALHLLASPLHVLARVSHETTAAGFGELLTGIAALVLAGCLLWLWATTLATCVEAATTRRTAFGPQRWRRIVLAGCGLTLALGTSPAIAAGSATSVPVPVPVPVTSPVPGGAEMLEGLPMPARPEAGQAVATPSASGAAVEPVARPDRADTVRVRPDDSLWALAEDDLPTGADDAEIDRRWQAIWEANRDLIGADPDLIHPGTLLRLPPAKQSSTDQPTPDQH